jgi:Stress responsive A/B Barrel Domain
MIRHIVLVRFADDRDPGRIAGVMSGIADLSRSIPGILAFSWGRNVSPEGIARGYTHAFTVDFADAAARDRYLADEDHARAGAALVAAADGGVEGILVLDFGD